MAAKGRWGGYLIFGFFCGVLLLLLFGGGRLFGFCFVFILEESHHSLGRSSLFEIFSRSRSTDPFFKGCSFYPLDSNFTSSFASEWVSSLGAQGLSSFVFTSLQLPGSCKLHCQVPFIAFIYWRSAMCLVGCWSQGNRGDQTLPLPPRTSQGSKKRRQEKAEGINRSTRGVGVPLGPVSTSILGQGSGSQLAYFPHLRGNVLHK